jgi:hypothetical protein
MDSYVLPLLCLAAFAAGLLLVVGGGGLIQTPMGLILLQVYPVSTLLNIKVPAGFIFAAYIKKVTLEVTGDNDAFTFPSTLGLLAY